MSIEILSLLGGVGLFLFGMQSMTGALREIAFDGEVGHRLVGARDRCHEAERESAGLEGLLVGAIEGGHGRQEVGRRK